FEISRPLRFLHSFPTRRSSDLWAPSIGTKMYLHCVLDISTKVKKKDHVNLRPLVQASAILPLILIFPICSLLPKLQVRLKEPFRSEEHTSELQSRENLVCRLLL